MWLWILAVLAAYFIKGLCGFANTLVLTTILSFGTDNADISPVDLLLCYPMNGIMTWKNRKKLDRRVCLTLSVLVLAGSIPGAFLLKNLDAHVLKLLFGVVVVFMGLETLWRKKGTMRSSKIVMGIIGVAAGLLCGLFGVGALLAAYINRVTDDSEAFKANICAVFLVENTFRVILYLCLGLIALSTVKQVLWLLPIAFVGLALGIISSRKLNEKHAKTVMAVLLIVSGLSLIVKNL